MLARRAEVASDDERSDLKLRMADLLLDRLDEPQRALDAYEAVLDLRPRDPNAPSSRAQPPSYSSDPVSRALPDLESMGAPSAGLAGDQ